MFFFYFSQDAEDNFLSEEKNDCFLKKIYSFPHTLNMTTHTKLMHKFSKS